MKILFLSNNEISNNLIYWLENEAKEEIVVYNKPINIEFLKKIKPNLIISYNYRFIIKHEIINYMENNIINLHISLLPWNRGAHPNMWSFLEDTPKGVTIHIIDEGIDTGPILVQKKVYIEESTETLKSSYERLHGEIQKLFKINWNDIKNKKLRPINQNSKGSFHYKNDFKRIECLLNDRGWNINIMEFKNKYKSLSEEKMYLEIKGKKIGKNFPVFIIAELSANHLQKFDNAVKLIKAAKKAGANAIKLQTYTPDTITIDCENEYFQIKQGTLWDGQTLYELYKKAYTPWEWQPKLKEIIEEEGLICFSSVFDKTAVDFLEKINVSAYKIASFEITDVPLIEYTASKRKPVIISTGIATFSDIEEAVNACKRMGNNQIALLKCTSAYPAPLQEINLKTIPNLADTFKTVVGLSDHTLGISVPIASVALGACIIEKHLILDRKLGGPDAAFSLEPDEFKTMVKSVREVEKALGEVSYDLTEKMKKSREFSRSLFVVKDMKAGEVFTEENIRSIRPGYGLLPKYLKEILGKQTTQDIKKGTPLKWELIN